MVSKFLNSFERRPAISAASAVFFFVRSSTFFYFSGQGVLCANLPTSPSCRALSAAFVCFQESNALGTDVPDVLASPGTFKHAPGAQSKVSAIDIRRLPRGYSEKRHRLAKKKRNDESSRSLDCLGSFTFFFPFCFVLRLPRVFLGHPQSVTSWHCCCISMSSFLFLFFRRVGKLKP